MKKRVRFSGANNGSGSFAFVFSDKEGEKYILDESKIPAKGMNPLIYDQLANLDDVEVRVEEVDGDYYITEVLWAKTNLR